MLWARSRLKGFVLRISNLTIWRDLVAKTLIIKNFPEDLHRRAKAKAALEGVTLKALIIRVLEIYLEENKE